LVLLDKKGQKKRSFLDWFLGKKPKTPVTATPAAKKAPEAVQAKKSSFLGWFLGKKPKTPVKEKQLIGKSIETTPAEKTLFQVEKEVEIIKLPELKDATTIDVRYPLIPPYAYAHIHWDNKENELVYTLEEPELNDQEKQILKKLEEGIKELINISFLNIKETNKIIEYLEKNLRVLLTEYKINITKDTFLKMMYYLYRDFVGMNEIEPLMNDYFIEDLECNGSETPIYLVHRKYRHIRTNIVFPDNKVLMRFVEKLAQKCGKYVSYASPLLDGSLPDGSRVNATYTTDITSRGPTFTIRKFTKEPWTPIKLMDFGTVSPEVLAYLWLAVEYGANIMVIGGTGSGKTSFLNSVAFFIPPAARIVTIEDSVTGDTEIMVKKKGKIQNTIIEKFIKYNRQETDAEILTLDKEYKLKFVKPSLLLKHKTKKDIYKITTATGRIIKVTQDHSLFILGEGGLKEVKPTDLSINKNFIAVPRKIPYKGKECICINLLDSLHVFKEDFLSGKPVQKIFKKYKYKDFGVSKSKYQWWKSHDLIKIKDLLKINFKFEKKDLQDLKIKSRTQSSLPILFKITKEFLGLIGLWLGDGSYDRYNKNRVIISNSDKECRDLVKKVAKQLNLNLSRMNDSVSLTINSTILYKFIRDVIGLKGRSSTKRIPEFIYNLSNKQLEYVIRGYFSADGCVKKYEVSCASQSLGLLHDLQTIFLRMGIISRINDFNRKDKCINLSISSYENASKFKNIGFLQNRKNKKLKNICNKKSHHAVSDIIPLSIEQLKEINNHHKISWPYLQGMQNIGRDYLQRIAPQASLFNDISHSDILWDKIKKIERLKPKERYVYDISVPGTEKFVCSNIIVHNTRELNLLHENWLPSVARAGVGLKTITGERHGEVSLFDLLKESFRQRPDYVIVGEIRGKEAFVLFQGAASGHPCVSTMHAESVGTMIKRLETPPISLSASLVESLNIVCVMIQTKVHGKPVRRLKEVVEIVSVPSSGDPVLNTPFVRDPARDIFFYKTDSHVLNKISKDQGIAPQQLATEWQRRTNLLMAMYRRKVFGFKDVHEVINSYYKKPYDMLRRFGLR